MLLPYAFSIGNAWEKVPLPGFADICRENCRLSSAFLEKWKDHSNGLKRSALKQFNPLVSRLADLLPAKSPVSQASLQWHFPRIDICFLFCNVV